MKVSLLSLRMEDYMNNNRLLNYEWDAIAGILAAVVAIIWTSQNSVDFI